MSIILLILVLLKSPSHSTKWTIFQLCLAVLGNSIFSVLTILKYGDNILEALDKPICIIQQKLSNLFFYPLYLFPCVLAFYLWSGTVNSNSEVENNHFWTFTILIWGFSFIYSSTVLTISRFEDNWGVVATNLSCEGTYNFRSKRYLDWLFQGITLTIASISLFFTTTNTEIKRISRDTVDSEAITIEVLTESDADNDRFSATFSENQKRIKRHSLQDSTKGKRTSKSRRRHSDSSYERERRHNGHRRHDDRRHHDRLHSSRRHNTDEEKKGYIDGTHAANFLKKSNLSSAALSKIWNLADYENQGVLTTQTFIIVVKLIALVQNGQNPDMALLKAKVPLPRFEDINIETAYIITDDNRESYKKTFLILKHEDDLVDGDKAREIFLQSKLSSETLFQIWKLADTKNRGRLDVNEFIIAMHLIKQYMSKNIKEIPQTLPSGFYEMAAGVNLDVLASSTSPSLFSGNSLTSSLNPDGFNTKSPFIEHPWDVTLEEKTKYDKIFDSIDQMKHGFLTGDEAAKIFVKSNLDQNTLAMIWLNLSDIDKTGRLNHEKFAVAMHLIQKKAKGFPLPNILPTSLTPPSMRHTTEGSSTLGHISKKDIGSTSSSISRYSTEDFFGLNDPTDSQNNFISDSRVIKEPQMIDFFGDSDLHTKIASESSEIKSYGTQINILGNSSDELENKKASLNSTLADLVIQKQEIKDLFLQTRSLYEAEFKAVEEIQIQYQLENENFERVKEEHAQAKRALAAIRLQKEQLEENIQKDKDEINELRKELRIIEEETVSINAKVKDFQKDSAQQKGLLMINKKQLETSKAEREKSLEVLKTFEKSNNLPDINKDAFVSTPLTTTSSNHNSFNVSQSMFNEPGKSSADFFNGQGENKLQPTHIKNSTTSTIDPFDFDNFKNATSDKSGLDSAFATLEVTNKNNGDDSFLTDTFNSEKFPSLEELEGLTPGNNFNFEKENKTNHFDTTKPDEKITSPYMNEDKVENTLKNKPIDLLKGLMKPSTNTKDAHNDISFFDPLASKNINKPINTNNAIFDSAFGSTFENAFFQGNFKSPIPTATTINNDNDDDIDYVKTLKEMGFPRENAIKALEDNDYDLNKAIFALSNV
ncbi:8386_t:CDS:10 [Entrophospora sp. SA101]|nr:8386_t:CDS:10 [Entrophospora sp. SA101]